MHFWLSLMKKKKTLFLTKKSLLRKKRELLILHFTKIMILLLRENQSTVIKHKKKKLIAYPFIFIIDNILFFFLNLGIKDQVKKNLDEENKYLKALLKEIGEIVKEKGEGEGFYQDKVKRIEEILGVERKK